ncbi:Chromosome transmission fidelity protein 18-like protein [Aphelenchoides fujianensis]|nr:Chromosome transmission fidelity protein 18-like protein [Aphelenchoides fujianensis]
MDENFGWPDLEDDEQGFGIDDGWDDEANLFDGDIELEPEVAPNADAQRPRPLVLQPTNVNNTPAAPAPSEKRALLENLPFGEHPLDWFANAENDAAQKKRRKLEDAQVRSENLLGKIQEKKSKRIESIVGKYAKMARMEREPLKVAPVYYEISDPDGLETKMMPGGLYEKWESVKERPKSLFEDEFLNGPEEAEEQVVWPQRRPAVPSSQLWTEKYSPRTFLDLLTSNEHNQTVLQWLKLWDPHVHGRPRPFAANDDEPRKPFFELEEQHPYLPKRKILLIYGPAGAGKSTLADICARQAGYQPVVLDAIDIPNAAACKAKVADVIGNTSIGAFFGKKKAPNCLVIESIENASADVINFFVTHANQKTKTKGVYRPIIMVCNNFFHPNLRKLRTICGSLNVSFLDKQRALQRLEHICRVEDLQEVRRHMLLELFERFCGDMRRCLSQLQFMCSAPLVNESKQSREQISQHSIFEALDRIITSNAYVESNKVFPPRERSRMISEMLAKRADSETIYDALLHNVHLAGKFKVWQLSQIGTLLADQNVLSAYIQSTQSYSLMRYTNAAVLLIHFLVAKPHANRLTYDLSFLKNREKVRASEGILESVISGLKAQSRLSNEGLLLDLLPALVTVLQTNCPTSTTQLQNCGANERAILNRLSSIMTFYGLNYVAALDKAVGELALDPRLDELAVIPSCKHSVWHAINKAREGQKKLVAQMLSTDETVSRPKAVQLLEMPDRRFAGLEVLKHGLNARSSNRVSQFTTTGFHYKQGNSTAIRCNAKNDAIFSSVIGK